MNTSIVKTKIVLTGFMGSGKTTVGKHLSDKLGYEMIDMDDKVLAISGRSTIGEIFKRDGEMKFRKLELATAKDLSKKQQAIIATGGGAGVNQEIINLLSQNGIIIYLETKFETIQNRLKNPTDRPLFNDFVTAKKLYDARYLLYKKFAQFIVKTDDKTTDEIANEIISLIPNT